ncbi:MAG: exonuclease domain-containing protein [Labilithrix sp.]|nr:exonuclease domain-containing protein [Labilithrix sp.]MCW5813551.1 exonuclease domain-containing protein [Labilithrix sp.]
MDTKQLPPFLLVVDLEATCDRDRATISKYEMETIEIGAVLVETATLSPVAELGTFVRPIRHPKLTPFCTELTTITQADVDDAPLFPEAIAKLRALIEGRATLFCSWGDYDKNQLTQDARLHGIKLPFGDAHLNLKRRFSEVLGLPKKLGMGQALREVGLRLEGTHHRGIDDARNIARLLPWIVGGATRPPQP